MEILIIDDTPVVAAGLSSILTQNIPQINITTADTINAFELDNPSKKYSHLILSTGIREKSEIERIDVVRQVNPNLHITVFVDNQLYFISLIRLRVNAVVGRKSTANELVSALNWTSVESPYLSGDIMQMIISGLLRSDRTAGLTKKELEVAELLLENMPLDKIEAHLQLKKVTILHYRRQIFKKLGVRNTHELSQVGIF